MSKRLVTLSTVSALIACLAGAAIAGDTAPAAAPAGEAVRVGAPVTTKKATDLAKLTKEPKKFVGRTIRIEGTVQKVCQGAGCWVEVAGANGVTFLAKSLDESVLLPKDCAGRRIVVQGVVTEMPAKGAEAHQHADHAAADHECPAPTYLVATQGAELPATKRR